MCSSKETYECEKRDVNVKRGLSMSKEDSTETYCRARIVELMCSSKETYECEKRPMNVKRDL